LLEKLNSKMVATRFMALKSITFSINQNQIDFSKMDMEIPEFTKNLVRIIELLAENDPEEMVKRESGVCIEILKKNSILQQCRICPYVLHVVKARWFHLVFVQMRSGP